MTPPSEPHGPAGGEGPSSLDPALADALRAVLAPLARLALARGVSCGAVEELLKEMFVDEAMRAQGASASGRMVSRISVATGLNRREVTRLTRAERAPRAVRQPPSSEVFARWITDPALRDVDGRPVELPRLPDERGSPSFETLARSVTRDVHPRSLLDELCRIGVARHDEATDRVCLLRADFVPDADRGGMLGFLGDNVGDHLNAAVANVTAAVPIHFEQAVFADELSETALVAVKALVRDHWLALVHGAVPALEALIEADRQAGRAQDRRVRIGMYSYAAPQTAPVGPAEESTP